MLWVLLAISVPVFYILGLVSVVREVFKSKRTNEPKEDRQHFLQKVISELRGVLAKTPNKTIAQQLKDYIYELRIVSGAYVFTPEYTTEVGVDKENKAKEAPQAESKPILQSDLSDFWTNWYSDNSINLLLYIGAFLIVASASIYVGFQWETLGGSVKAFVLSGLTLAFLLFGFWFYYTPKIQRAGATFIAIASLLIPFNGLAWYNFVLKPEGFTFGTVWLMTSCVAIVMYSVLAYTIRHPFYTYIASFSGLSLAFSTVRNAQLRDEYYVLAGVFTALLLLLCTKLFTKLDKETTKNFVFPLTISSHIIMPVSLLWGLMLASTENKLFILESVLALVFACAYYFLAYSFDKKDVYLVTAESLVPTTVFFFGKWAGLTEEQVFYFVEIVLMSFFAIAFLVRTTHKKEATFLRQIALVFAAAIALVTFTMHLEALHKTFFALFPAAFGFISWYREEHPGYIYYHLVFALGAVYLYVNEVLHLSNELYFLGIVYIALGCVYYLLSLYNIDKPKGHQAFLASVVTSSTLGFILTFEKPGYFFVSNVAAFVMSMDYAFRFKKDTAIYFSNMLLFVALSSVLRFFDLRLFWYPLLFTAYSAGFYLVSLIVPARLVSIYKNTALVGNAATAVISFIVSQAGAGSFTSRSRTNFIDSQFENTLLERNGLISAYAASALFAFDAYMGKIGQYGYISSAIGIATYLWQMKYLGYTETQVFTLPLGVYFMVIGFLQRGKPERRTLWEYLGLFFLFVPLLTQTVGVNGVWYALLMAVEGFVLFSLGTTINYKKYVYAGIGGIVGAVLSQTYDFLFSLPRWVITAVAGLLFLSSAIFLLLRRK